MSDLFFKKKTFACGPALREPFVRGYLHGSRQKEGQVLAETLGF